jgi:hypothetical protein
MFESVAELVIGERSIAAVLVAEDVPRLAGRTRWSYPSGDAAIDVIVG